MHVIDCDKDVYSYRVKDLLGGESYKPTITVGERYTVKHKDGVNCDTQNRILCDVKIVA